MILIHVSITSSVEVRVCQKLSAYVPLQKPTKYQLWLGNLNLAVTKKNPQKNNTSTLQSPVYNSSDILKGCWVTYWKILCMFLFLKVSKPLYGYSQYVSVMLFTLPILVMW